MGLKLFSSIHEGGKEGSETRFYEKQIGMNHLWILTLLPISNSKVEEIMKHLQILLSSKLLDSTTTEDVEENFERALKDLNDTLPEVIGEDAETILRTGAMIIGYLHDEELLVSSFGQGEVFLLRNRSLMEISEGLSPTDTKAEFFQNISSGDVQDGDKLIFSTYRLKRYITERQIITALEDGVTEAMEGITSTIDTSENGNILLLNVKISEPLSFEQKNEKAKISRDIFQNTWNQICNTGKNLFQKTQRVFPKLKKSHALLIGAGAIALLLLFLFFNLLSGQNNKKENIEYTEFINTIEQQLSTVETRFIEGKIDQANLILDRIEDQASEMLQKRVDVVKADQILAIVRSKREYVNRIMRITNPEVMADLSAINSEIESRGFFFLKNEIITFDKDSLYRTLISGTKAEGLGKITDNGELTMGVSFPAKDEGVFMTKGGNVLEWENGQTITADTADATWKPAREIKTFSKFLYFLDNQSGQIWKYERRESGFTLAEGWATTGKEVLKDAVSFAIDGSIFALTKSEGIVKFHLNEKVDYELKDVPNGTLKGDKIYTDADLGSLFVLDKEDHKVLIFSKFENEAVYKKQIILEGTEGLVDLFATENKLYVLGKQRIYEIALNGDE